MKQVHLSTAPQSCWIELRVFDMNILKYKERIRTLSQSNHFFNKVVTFATKIYARGGGKN